MKNFKILTMAVFVLFFIPMSLIGQEIQYETMMGTRGAWLEMRVKNGVSLTLLYSPSLTTGKLELPCLSFGINDSNLHGVLFPFTSSDNQQFSIDMVDALSYMEILGDMPLESVSLRLDMDKQSYQWMDKDFMELQITMPFVTARVSRKGKFFWRPNNSTSVVNKRVKDFFLNNNKGTLKIYTKKGRAYTLQLDENVFLNIRRLMDAFK